MAQSARRSRSVWTRLFGSGRSKRKLDYRLVQSMRLGFEPLEDRRLLSASPSSQQAIQLFDASPALFVANQGQIADSSVRYAFNSSGANVLMTDSGPVFQIFQQTAAGANTGSSVGATAGLSSSVAAPGLPDPLATAAAVQSEQFSVTFEGANTVTPVGLQQAATTFNYFVGDSSQWRTNVPAYQQVAYDGLYSGINLVTYGQSDSLKYEFDVAPGANYQQIAVHYSGIEGLSIDSQGVLHIQTALGQLTDAAPVIYQNINGQQVAVAGRFQLLDADTYTFVITGPYNPRQQLVIDPNVTWATYLGGSGNDSGGGIAVDGAGNAMVTGYAYSTDFAGANNTNYGGEDAFVAKITSSGVLVWATYLGGSSVDIGMGVAVDSAGDALVTGYTLSSNFAGANNTYYGNGDAFVAKVTSSGSLAWSTYLGGSGADWGYGIAVDSAGNALVTGSTNSNDFTGANNSFHGGTYAGDAFVAKVTSSGNLAWATYLGGSGYDEGQGIALDSAGNALVTGYTLSSDFAGANNTYYGDGDAFVAKVTSSGTLAWATYLGGNNGSFGTGIAVDSAGNALVTGDTASSDLYGANNSYDGKDDAFVAKVTSSGVLVWATYLGGSEFDQGCGIAVDSAGNALVTGMTYSTDFREVTNSYQGNGDPLGCSVAFVAEVTSNGVLTWATYLDGNGEDDGCGIAVDSEDYALVTGWTDSTNFAGVIKSPGSNGDVFVAKLPLTSPTLTVSDAGGTFNGFPYAATATVAGSGGIPAASLEGVTPTVTYYVGTAATGSGSSVPPSASGTYTAVASFPGSPDYAPAQSNPVTFNIAFNGYSTPVVTVADGGGVFTGSPYAATATVAGIGGTAASGLEGVSPMFTYYVGSTATGGGSSTAPSGVGTYTVVASFPGSTDYTAAQSNPATFCITRATPTVIVWDYDRTYNGSPFPATATVAGVNGIQASSLEGVTPTCTYYYGSTAAGGASSTPPSAPGTYTVVASFAGSTDYTAAQSSPVTFEITVNSPVSGAYTTQEIRQAYGIDSIVMGSVIGNGAGQTIAIIDAYDDPDLVSTTSPNFASSDLHQFDTYFGLPDPPSFSKLDENGGTNYPGVDPAGPGNSWESEEALDVEWAHAAAPDANLVLIEMNSGDMINAQFFSDLTKAVNTARNLAGVSVVSMSFGVSEAQVKSILGSSGEATLDALFTTPAGHQGITFVASAGDEGSPAIYPACSPNVVAVGGTSLYLYSNGSYSSESAWSHSGGGQSLYEAEPSYQQGVQSSGYRQTPDVAFDANPNTGVAVYDSYDAGTSGVWSAVGGTSIGAPCWAGLIAIADQLRASQGLGSLDGPSQTLPDLYALPASDFHDITTGGNGTYSAGPGYDEVTGLGTPVANKLVADLATSLSVVGSGDLSGNGNTDLLWENQNPSSSQYGEVGAWLVKNGTITGQVTFAWVDPTQWKLAGTGDFTGNGTTDILWINTTNGEVGVWLINNAKVTGWSTLAYVDLTTWNFEGIGDFNGNGTSDVLWQNNNGLVGAWLINNSAASAWDGMPYADPTQWKIIGLGDFTGDGTTDVLWQNTVNGGIGAWLVNNGAVSSWMNLGGANPTVWKLVGVGDFNNNSTADLLWENQTTPGTYGEWLVQNNSISWVSLPYADPTQWQLVAVANVCGGTSPDLVWESLSTGMLGAWEIQHGTVAGWSTLGQC